MPSRLRERPLLYGNSPAWVSVLYEAENGGNILDDGMLELVRKFEEKLLTGVNGVKRADGALHVLAPCSQRCSEASFLFEPKSLAVSKWCACVSAGQV